MPKESAIAKSTGLQKEEDRTNPDNVLSRVVASKKKISKDEARYHKTGEGAGGRRVCAKCKFNLGDEGKCHIVRGNVDTDHGVSKFFSPKGKGMLPGDIVWDVVKQTGKKLAYKEGYVIMEGAKGFQCQNCKYYLYSGNCLIIKGKFKPKMSCGFIVRVGNGVRI